MLPRWLAREQRTLSLSLCLWTFLHFSIKLILWLLLKWPLDVSVNPMDVQTVCVHKDMDLWNCQCITQWKSNGDYCFSHKFRCHFF